MLVALPLLAFLFLLLGFRRRLGWRASFLAATLPWALWLTFITELLTQFRDLTRTSVAIAWLLFGVACLVWMLQRFRSVRVPAPLKLEPLSWSERLALLCIAGIVALVGVTALFSAPDTWDAMMYHLPRVVEWINNRGVQFFPTIDRFQLYQPPFAEYTMLHLELLYGSDRLLGLVQWISFIGCILAASLIAGELGGTRRSQIVAAIFCATIPTAILEASGTKTEVVAAYWIAAAVYFLLRWRSHQDWPQALAIGASLGLAVFTKGTSYAFLPCIVLACVAMWSGVARHRFWSHIPAIAAIGILVCAPLWTRNYRYTGSPLGLPYFDGPGSIQGRMLENARITPVTIVANVARNVALHAGVPSDRINAFSTRAFSGFIRAIGADPNDPGQLNATSFGNTPRFKVWFHPRYEVLAGDPFPLVLLLLSGALFLIYRRKLAKEIGWLWLGLIGAVVLHAALLRWSQWNARYELPIFVLGASIAAVALVETLPRWTVNLILALVFLYAVPLVLMNETRPLLTRHGLTGSVLTMPRDDTYFLDFHQKDALSFIAAANAARNSGCHSFGLDANLYHFEYPMMALLEQGGIPRQIRYVDVENSSVRYAQPSPPPLCMVICMNCLNNLSKTAEYSTKFPKTQAFGTILLFGQ